jgi:coenzyme F420-reducing hydrogenase delta subunit
MNKLPLKISLFCCTNSVDHDELSRYCMDVDSDVINLVDIPCSGKVDLLYLIKVFETGADGALIVTCKEDECTYLEGNLRAQKRAQAIDELLCEIGLGSGRMAVVQLTDQGQEKVFRDIDDFREKIRALPANKLGTVSDVESRRESSV